MRKRTFRFAAAAAAGALALGLLAACGSDDDDSDSSGGGSGSSDKSVAIPIAAGWDEDIAISYLWKHVLEEDGYDVSVETLDIGPAFAGVAGGDFDLFFDTWLPTTHADYWKQYKDQVEDLGVWYDQATLNIAVPDYVDAETIGDLKGMEDEFGGVITGIDPGAGLTRVTKDDAMPEYGLDDYTLKTSSTAAMLAALQKAIDAKDPIVVTLWHPHWAYSAFPIKDLEDPEGAMGGAEKIHSIASQDFADSNSEVTDAVSDFKMDDETLADLEKVVLQEHKDDPEAGVEAWVKDNQDFVDDML
ncbi:MAG TPA: glycine betaine ABC transporter substrate-binding protein [Nocardioidaceae bacterium]|nr:glycine betaine ABC transporter substrate-binding protein [Nocardioidaceae bacterium]